VTGFLRGGRDLNLSKPKRQNLWHHADLRANAVSFRGVRGQGRTQAWATTYPRVDPDSLPSWQMGANGFAIRAQCDEHGRESPEKTFAGPASTRRLRTPPPAYHLTARREEARPGALRNIGRLETVLHYTAAMDPVALAAVTSAVTVLGTKVAEGAASEAGKSLWGRVKELLGWKGEPPSAEIATRAAEHLQNHPEDAPTIIQLLQQDKGSVGMLVGHIDAEKVVVARKIDTINM
jgi:hypothetical protein